MTTPSHHLPSHSAPIPTNSPPKPTFTPPANLHHNLQTLSFQLIEASINCTPPYAPILSASIRKHFLLSVRCRLYATAPDAFWQPEHDACYLDRFATSVISNFVTTILQAPHRPIRLAYDQLYAALSALPQSDPTFGILSAIWRDLLQPLRNHLFDWLYFAEVHDGNCQFFIESTDKPQIVAERLPDFILPHVGQRILQAGKARGVAIQLAKGHRMFILLGDEEQAQRTLMNGFLDNPINAQLELDAASLQWRLAATQRLSSLLPFEHIRRKVLLLRQYLLLGHAAFWRSFFDELRKKPLLLASGELDKVERRMAEKAVHRILISTTAEHEESDDVLETVEPPLSLEVSSTGGIVPRFSLTFAESQVLESKSSVYCDVFSIAFNVRRVACELRASFINLHMLDKCLRRASRSKGWRPATACLVGVLELRRRMAIFVDGFEWYLQAEVLQPKFDQLHSAIDDYLQGREARPPLSSRQPFFDEILALHETLLDQVFAQCFVGHEQIDGRLTAIFSACFSLCDFIGALTVESLQQNDYSDTLRELQTTFTRNVALLVRLLLHLQHRSADSGIPALLVRINFNHYVKD